MRKKGLTKKLSEETLELIPDFANYVFDGGAYKEKTKYLNKKLNYPRDREGYPYQLLDSRIFKGYCGKYLEFREGLTKVFIPFMSLAHYSRMPFLFLEVNMLPIKDIYSSELIRDGYYLMMDSIKHLGTCIEGNCGTYNRTYPFLTKLNRDLLYCILLDSGVEIALNYKGPKCRNKISVSSGSREIDFTEAIYATTSNGENHHHIEDIHRASLSLLNLQEYHEFNVAILEKFFKNWGIDKICFKHKKMKLHLKSQEKKYKKMHK